MILIKIRNQKMPQEMKRSCKTAGLIKQDYVGHVTARVSLFLSVKLRQPDSQMLQKYIITKRDM